METPVQLEIAAFESAIHLRRGIADNIMKRPQTNAASLPSPA